MSENEYIDTTSPAPPAYSSTAGNLQPASETTNVNAGPNTPTNTPTMSMSPAQQLKEHAAESAEEAVSKMAFWYDNYFYRPVQRAMLPYAQRLRHRPVDFLGHDVDPWSPTSVAMAGILFILPIGYFLKYGMTTLAALTLIGHDLLSHFDGAIAVAQGKQRSDDAVFWRFARPLLDKRVNLLSLWSMLLLTYPSVPEAALLMGLSFSVFVTESVLTFARASDYFEVLSAEFQVREELSRKRLAPSMDARLKEKLEALGVAALIYAQGYAAPLMSWAGILGFAMLAISIPLGLRGLRRTTKSRLKEKQYGSTSAPQRETYASVVAHGLSDQSRVGGTH